MKDQILKAIQIRPDQRRFTVLLAFFLSFCFGHFLAAQPIFSPGMEKWS